VSWQATAWAIRQATGSPSRKVILLALANYADQHGVCWPSQATLARGTEQSVDTVQRQLRKLQELGIIERERMPKRRGQWQGFRYKLPLQTNQPETGLNTVRSHEMRSGQTATGTSARPQSLRLKPSIEPSIEPSLGQTRVKHRGDVAEERLQAFQRRQEGSEVVQNRIARRIGDDGWLVLGDMSDAQRARLSTLERQGQLNDETLESAVLAVRFVPRS
jgi:DNA-binding transcriptional MocR family regulator